MSSCDLIVVNVNYEYYNSANWKAQCGSILVWGFFKTAYNKKKFVTALPRSTIQYIPCSWTTKPLEHHYGEENINELQASCVTLVYTKPMHCQKRKGFQREVPGRHRKHHKIQ